MHLLSLDHKTIIIPTKNVASYLIFSRTAWFSAVFTQQHKIQPFLVTFGCKNVLRFTDNMTVLQCVVYGRCYWYWSIQMLPNASSKQDGNFRLKTKPWKWSHVILIVIIPADQIYTGTGTCMVLASIRYFHYQYVGVLAPPPLQWLVSKSTKQSLVG